MNKNGVISPDKLDPLVWGPPFWFFLHTLTLGYPEYPNDVTKRKYYDLIQNIPLFVPNAEMGGHFAHLLDIYPVSPYLVSRDSFVRWMIHIHNRMNRHLGKEEMELLEAMDQYMSAYQHPLLIRSEHFRFSRRTVLYGMMIALVVLCIYLSRKYVLMYRFYKSLNYKQKTHWYLCLMAISI